MKTKDADKSTPRESQRRLFIKSLYHELDKLSSQADTHNSELVKRANQLVLEDGFSKDSAVDLLIMDGFEATTARQFVETLKVSETMDSEEDLKTFDYCFEDHRGRTFSGRELGNVVEAGTKEQAHSMVTGILSAFEPPVKLLSVDEVV